VAEYVAHNFPQAQMLVRGTRFQITTTPAIAYKRGYGLVLFQIAL